MGDHLQMKNTVVRVEKSGNRFNAWDSDGNKWTSEISTGTRKKAFLAGNALERRVGKTGRTYWWQVDMSEFEKVVGTSGKVKQYIDALEEQDRAALDVEFQQLKREITRIASKTTYNNKVLLDGGFSSDGIRFHIGPQADDGYIVKFNDMTASG